MPSATIDLPEPVGVLRITCLPAEDLEQCLLLVGVEGEPGIGRPGDEAVEELFRGGAGSVGEALGQKGSDGHGTILSSPAISGDGSAPKRA